MKHPFSQFKYCPKCGSTNFTIADEKSKICKDCGFHYYFNACAAVVGLIVNENNQLLVCKRAKDPCKGTLDICGGFVDLNETAEQAVIREVKEETNLDITSLKYLFSYPNVYPFSNFNVHTLDMFYLCKVSNYSSIQANDDVQSCRFIPIEQINIKEFGLKSIQRGLEQFIKDFKSQK